MPTKPSDMPPLGLRTRITQFDGAHEWECVRHELDVGGMNRLAPVFAGAAWEIVATLAPTPDCDDALDGRITFRVTEGTAREAAVALEWPVAAWSRDVFVMLPAAAYNGNRYPCRTLYLEAIQETAPTGRAPIRRAWAGASAWAERLRRGNCILRPIVRPLTDVSRRMAATHEAGCAITTIAGNPVKSLDAAGPLHLPFLQ